MEALWSQFENVMAKGADVVGEGKDGEKDDDRQEGDEVEEEKEGGEKPVEKKA